jgi:murein DD-endopeptidase MepM/ murein hydrolase activator NlpD
LRYRPQRLRFAALAFAACAITGVISAPAFAANPADPGGAQISISPGAAQTSGVPEGVEADLGGVSAPGDPVVSRVVCKTGCPPIKRSKRGAVKARPGSVIKLKGEFLDYVQYVVFRGPTGPMPAPLTYGDANLVRAIVPDGAISSRPYVIDHRSIRSNRTRRKLVIRPALATGSAVFPIQGTHDYGGPGARFGASRSGHIHQGQDVFAACGTPLVSAMTGTVQYAGYQGSAGNYIVIDNNGSDTDFVYMHLAYPATIRTVNAPVAAGQQIGAVGESGNAEGCHLHFEYWQGDWWGGGEPIDPLPYLKAWDSSS